MKSEKAKSFITNKLTYMLDPRYVGHRQVMALGRNNAYRAVELAEQEAEERMRTRAHKIILEMMTGIFHGDMPRKIADEFIQKLNEE